MARAALVVALLAVSAVVVFAADEVKPEHYGYVDPPHAFKAGYADPCDGPANLVTATSPVFGDVPEGAFRELTLNCAGENTCIKTGPNQQGCKGFSEPGDTGSALNPGRIDGVVAGATLQIGGFCEIKCRPDAGFADNRKFTVYKSGWWGGLSEKSSKTICGGMLVDNSNIGDGERCRVVATAVCCKPKHHKDY